MLWVEVWNLLTCKFEACLIEVRVKNCALLYLLLLGSIVFLLGFRPGVINAQYYGQGSYGGGYSESAYYSESSYVTYANISGRVYVDANNNGVQDCSGACNNGPGDELGRSGVTVVLSGGDSGSTTTSSTGAYAFNNREEGQSYTVTITNPSGFYATTANPVTFTLSGDASVNFGITNQDIFNVSGTVFVDTNANGVQNCSGACNNGFGDELNYNGATVTVTGEGSAVTNSSGVYTISNVAGGSRTVTLTLPVGYYDTTVNPRTVTVGPDPDVDFGITNTANMSISGNVFDDQDGDQIQDCNSTCNNGFGDEPGVASVTVARTGVSSGSTTTDPSGSDRGDYSFTSLGGGAYNITVTAPSGYYLTTTNPIVTSLGPNRTGISFGVTNDAEFTISGNVYIDTNGNGVQDCSGACNNGGGDELGYANATVGRTGVSSGSTTTDPSGSDLGNYSFTNLFPGDYTLTLTVPSGYVASTTNPVQSTIPPNGTVNFGIVLTPQCSDGLNNDPSDDSLTDEDDGGCHTDGNPDNPASYDPIDNSELPACSDGIDNDSTGGTDTADAGCHTDGNPGNPGSYDPDFPSEAPIPPLCAELTAVSDTLNAGQIANLSVTSCASLVTPTYNWPDPTSGTVINVDDPDTTYTAPSGVCVADTDTQTVEVTNANGTSIYSVDITLSPGNTVSGAVYIDTLGNNCDSGATPYTAGAVLTTYPDGTFTDTTDGLGEYSITDTATCGDRTIGASSLGDYTVRRVRFDNGAWDNAGLSGYSYGPFDLSVNRTVDFCVNNIGPWVQTTSGDVRMNNISINVPPNNYASDGTLPSVFYSSNFESSFTPGSAATTSWIVNDEYSYQEDAKNRNGTMSYSFFNSKIGQLDVATQNICDVETCVGNDVTVSDLPTGIYTHAGDLNITSYSHLVGAHVLFLVNGNLTISSNITVPAGVGNLLILAAKDDIIIAETVGTGTLSGTPAGHIQAILTAEGNVLTDGTLCASAVSDLQIGIQGAIIANAARPFSSGGGGSFQNGRSLCGNDRLYPVVRISPRLDFVTQLTDFYKTTYSRWRELNP